MNSSKIAVMVGPKGRGSNMAALVRASKDGVLSGDVDKVISPTESSPALERARELGVAAVVVPYGEDYGQRLCRELLGYDFLCLAGFMRLLPQEVLALLPGRILNIHPALLPKYGGKGMYGHHVHEAVINASESESGCTVHLVTEEYDEGRIIKQLKCPVFSDDTADSLAARVLTLEHQAYVEALQEMIIAT